MATRPRKKTPRPPEDPYAVAKAALSRLFDMYERQLASPRLRQRSDSWLDAPAAEAHAKRHGSLS